MPIIIDEEKIKFDILKELVVYLTPKFKLAASKATNEVKPIVRNAIETSDHYYSMMPGGILYHMFGNPNLENDIRSIVDKIIDGIDTNVVLSLPRLNSNEISAIFTINILRSDFSDILSLPGATFSSMNKDSSVVDLKWLDWLLLRGTSGIVLDYHYIAKTRGSRTGLGLMVKGGSWGVPLQYSGTLGNNWLTKSMFSIQKTVEETIERTFYIELGG